MVEHAVEFGWSGEGEGAGILVYAPDEGAADPAFRRALPAATLPGVDDPVYAAASTEGFGWVAASSSHAAPDLVSAPARHLLLVADVAAGGLGVPLHSLTDLALRNLAEIKPSMPPLNGAGVRRVCEEGASAAAEDGFVEEEDLAYLGPDAPGDPDALGRRAILAGTRDWEDGFGLEISAVGEVFDGEGAEALDLRPGTLAVVVKVVGGDLGRLAIGAHRERMLVKIRAGVDFGAGDGLPAAPLETEEANDLISAAGAAANFADARAARAVYALRRAFRDTAGGLAVRASWRVGGFERLDASVLHRKELAAADEGEVLVSGGVVAAGTGNMSWSAPTFGASESDGRWPWEEAGLLGRWAALDPTGGEG